MHREKMDAAKARRQAVRRSRAAQVLSGGAAATGNGASCDFPPAGVSEQISVPLPASPLSLALRLLSPVLCASIIIQLLSTLRLLGYINLPHEAGCDMVKSRDR